MATLLWQRDLASDVNGVKNTYSSWDSCMTKAYCKWPAIVGIIIGSLIVFSLLWCCFRCLCCGMECCCGCFSCCNACCPSPRRGGRNNDGYQQQPPSQPIYQQPYPQYQSHAPPMYGGAAAGGYRGAPTAQTATFGGPTRSAVQPASAAAKYNEDALPAMPSWDNAASRHVEEEDVEMEKLDPNQAQQQSLLSQQQESGRYYNNQQDHAGDLGAMHSAQPYHDYTQQQQYAPSIASTAQQSAYPPTYHSGPDRNSYAPPGQQYRGYEPSVAPSYHTTAPAHGIVSPLSQSAPQGNGIGRKPVQGTWRDV